MTDPAALLPAVEVEAEGEATAAVVWLHGLGADGNDFPPLVPYLEMPWARFVFPHAPRRPVTLNGGMVMRAWYDITGIGPGGSDVGQIRTSRGQVEALLQRERDRGVPESRIVLAGFSQGGAIALYTGLRFPRTLAGIVVLSAYELLGETLAAEATPANLQTPILFCHGTGDPLVPVERGRLAHAARIAEGRPAQWHEFAMGHEVCLEEIQVIAGWLHDRLPREPGR